VDPSRLSPSGQYGRLDKMARDDEAAVDSMVKKAQKNAEPWYNPEMEKIIKKWDQENQPVKSKGQRPWGTDIEEQSRKKRKEPEVDYDAIDHDKSVARLRHLAGIGPMKTVYDPNKRVYKNVPTADQPKR
jgi:hypothetical protein